MKHIAIVLLLSLLVLVSACANHPNKDHESTAAQPPASVSNASNIVRATLGNGLKVIIVRDAFAPVATQQITYFAGSNQSPEGFPGRAHAQEHMMFRGSPGLSKSQLARIIALLGGNMNAFTGDNFTWYYFTVPSHDLDVALHVGALRMADVNDSETEWKKERGAIEQEVARDHSSPGRVLRDKLIAHMFAGTPYALDGVGTRAAFDKTTAAMLKAFHDKWYAPNNALLVITGDIDPEAVLGKVKKLYGAIPARQIPGKPDTTFAPVTATTLSTETDQPYGYVELAFRVPGYRSRDYPAADILGTVLNSRRGPIAALRYAGKALNAGFSMGNWTETGIGTAWAAFSPGKDPAKVEHALLEALRKVLENGIDPDLIAAAKRRVVLNQQLKKNSIHGLANAWTRAITRSGLDSPAEVAARLRAVTAPEVDTQAKKLLDLQHAVTLIAEPKPGAKPTQHKSTGGAESFVAQPGGSVALPAWADMAFEKLPRPEPVLHPKDMQLRNGIRLIVQPLKVSHSVILLGHVHHNTYLQTPRGQMGVAGLLNSLFDWGPKGMTRLEFARAQDEIGIDLSLGSGFSLKALPENFDAGVRLLADALLHPSLPSKAFQHRRAVMKRYYAHRAKSPRFKFDRAMREGLYPKGDPALRLATAGSVGGLTLKQVRAYYDKVFRPDETTIVVLGDITPTKARAAIEKYFGAWRSSGPRPDLYLPSIPPSKPSRVFVPDASRVQNVAWLGETIDLTVNDPAHFALDLASDFMGGRFYASPLMKELREKRGLVYSVGTSVGFEHHRGFFYLSFGADPGKTPQARRISLQVLDRLRAKPISEKQLHLAKSIGLRKIALQGQSVHSIGSYWLDRSTNDLPLDWSYVMAHHYEKLTAGDLQQALEKYIDPARLSTFVLGPPAK